MFAKIAGLRGRDRLGVYLKTKLTPHSVAKKMFGLFLQPKLSAQRVAHILDAMAAAKAAIFVLAEPSLIKMLVFVLAEACCDWSYLYNLLHLPRGS